MKKAKFSFTTFILLSAILLLSSSVGVTAQLRDVSIAGSLPVVTQQTDSQTIRLFSPQQTAAAEADLRSGDGSGEVLRRRVLLLETTALTRLSQVTAAAPPTFISFDLFPDLTVQARVTGVSRDLQDASSLTGVIERTGRNPEGYFTLVRRGAVRAGETPVIVVDIQLGPRQFEIRPLRGGAYELLEINPYAPKPDLVIGFKGDSTERGRDEAARLVPVTPRRVDTVDVLVVYTTATLNAAETVQNLEAIIDLGAQKTNTALSGSRTEAQVRVVGKVHIPWWQEGNDTLSTDLSALQTSTKIRDLRQQFRADIVVLIRAPDNLYYGIAFCQGEVPSRSRAFSVVDYGHIARYAVMGHEIGHNFGCDHNRGASQCGIVPYAYGQWFYGDSGTLWGTMMSYEGSRVLFYSNPDVNWDGQPTGLAGARDNARRIRETKATLAAFF